MKLRTLTLEGFRSYRAREEIDLTGSNLAVIVGANGIGKSSLIYAVEWALYGTHHGSSVVDVISRDQDKCTVTLTFDLNDVTYRVVRHRTRKGRHEVLLSVSDPTVSTGWRDLAEKNPMSADPFLTGLLGMDAATARSTWLITQGSASSFCDAQPATRRVMLGSAFGLERFAALEEAADESRRAARLAKTAADARLDTLRADRDRLSGTDPLPDIEDISAACTAAEREVDDLSAALGSVIDTGKLRSAAADADAALAEFDQAAAAAAQMHAATRSSIERRCREADAHVAGAREAARIAVEAAQQIPAKESQLAAAKAECATTEQALNVLREQVATARAQLSGATSARDATVPAGRSIGERVNLLTAAAQSGTPTCYTCGQSLTPQHVANVIAKDNDEAARLRDAYRAQSATCHTLNATIQSLTQQAEPLQVAHTRADQAARTLDSELARLRHQAADGDAAQQRLAAAEQAAAQARQELEGMPPPPVADPQRREALAGAAARAAAAVAAAADDEARRAQLATNLAAARTRVRELIQEDARRLQAGKALAQLEDAIADAEEAVTDAADSLATAELLYEGFRPTGAPAMILAGIVEEINDEANDLLGLLGSDSLGVQVRTSRETQRGTSVEQITVTALTAHGDADFSTLSGAEKLRVALSLRLAMSRCIARRTGTPMQTLIMDEGWGALDESSQRALQDVLTRVSREFDVFTVSHIDAVKAGFPTVVSVNMNEGTSRAELVAA